MIAYIQEIAGTIQVSKEKVLAPHVEKIHGIDVPDIHSLFQGFTEELNRLDPRDFDPASRHDFVMLRIVIRNYAKGQIGNGNKAAEDADRMSTLLNSYMGKGSGAATRQFPKMTNVLLQRIVERDYRELSQKAFPDGSWKSTVILSGSILEAVLFDRLTKDPASIATAMDSPKAPVKKGGLRKDITINDRDNEWTLNDMIKVVCDLEILPLKDENAIHYVLREYRNLVHPRLEAAMGIEITEGHATTSKGLLDVCLDQIKY